MTTNTYTELTQEQLESLADGKTVSYDGYLLRLIEEPDEYAHINDFDCYGKVVPAPSHSYRWNVANRPEDFDGMAEIMWSQSYRYWWQPPNWDKATRRQWHTDSEYQRSLRSTVRDILSFGFYAYKLELCDTKTDAYGNPIVLACAYSGSYEPFMSNADKHEVISELLYEVWTQWKA